MVKYDKFVESRLAPAEQESIVKEGFLPKMTRLAASVPFAREAVAAYNCFCDSVVPTRIKAAIVVPLAYFVIPIDLIPDIVPALGYTDDMAALTAAFSIFRSHVTDQHYKEADGLIERLKNSAEKA